MDTRTRTALLAELEAITYWDDLFHNAAQVPLGDSVAFQNRQHRRQEITKLLLEENAGAPAAAGK